MYESIRYFSFEIYQHSKFLFGFCYFIAMMVLVDWRGESILHIPSIQVVPGHLIPSGAGAVHHPEHLALPGAGGGGECL